MNIYLAAPWTYKADAKAFAARLETIPGVRITKPWWEHPEMPEYPRVPAHLPLPTLLDLREQAEEDVAGVLDADLMVVLQLGKSEGKAVEQGIAHTLHLPVYVYAPERQVGNLFQYLQNVACFPTLDALLLAVQDYQIEHTS